MRYKDKLKDPRWKKRRREILKRDNNECQYCGYKSKSNHAHHLAYEKYREPWEYEDYYLITLCKYCHDNEHDIEKKLKEMRLSGMLWTDIINKTKLKF